MGDYFEFMIEEKRKIEEKIRVVEEKRKDKYTYVCEYYIDKEGHKKTRKIKCWYNNTQGQYIVNAESGLSMNGVKVGSKEENDFIKIKICSNHSTPATLYYYTAEEAFKHIGVMVKK